MADQDLKDVIASLDKRLASIEMILKVIANATQAQTIGPTGQKYYFQIEPLTTVPAGTFPVQRTTRAY